MSFRSFDEAFTWAKTHGRENCRPCDKWEVQQDGSEFRVAVMFKSGKFIGWAE